jgi:hypothetical protein
MEHHRELLSPARLSVISAEPSHELELMANTIAGSVRIDGRSELEALFGELLAGPAAHAGAPRTLDLIGHSAARGSQLRLGDWVIDAASPTVTAFFRGLADDAVMPRLGISAVRLLGCNTAETEAGRSTICRLAEILGVEVYGSTALLHDAHYDEHGFCDRWAFLLVGSSELQRAACAPVVIPDNERWPRSLDIDALPARPLEPHTAPWPMYVATAAAAQRLVALIRRSAGAQMPALLAAPVCELALPSAASGCYHAAQVLLDGAFVRFYPDGAASPGVVFPIDDASALRRIIDELASGLSHPSHSAPRY